ncbi:exported protein of unknown function [Sterolibacterium denitrificans]|uniref:Trimeric autotransporter adhesin YadA-like C-terminal membrane anchor domain-containing protein n=1 Tax=Sterolibacterium denitrificans TaxID=157592 RepID=A0A7Z7HRD6_9PROT|nr:YadA-like family protein [Sterolibacterium denitrificans]SMB27238.1 exported protein of unknown function [Sterolibacterium denitrificans]
MANQISFKPRLVIALIALSGAANGALAQTVTADEVIVQQGSGSDVTLIDPNAITIVDDTNGTTTSIDQSGYSVQGTSGSASVGSNGNITASGNVSSATLNVGPATPALGSTVLQVGTTAGKTTLGVQNVAGTVNGVTSTASNTTLRGGSFGQTTLKLDDTGVSFAAFGVAPVRVHGVADGVAPTDAVNKRQLDALSDQVGQFDGRIGNLESRVDKMDKRMSAGIASTMAAVNIPQVDSDKTFALGVGLGSYNSESALAVGASYRLAPDAVLKASVASGSGSGSKASFGVGAAMSW